MMLDDDDDGDDDDDDVGHADDDNSKERVSKEAQHKTISVFIFVKNEVFFVRVGEGPEWPPRHRSRA